MEVFFQLDKELQSLIVVNLTDLEIEKLCSKAPKGKRFCTLDDPLWNMRLNDYGVDKVPPGVLYKMFQKIYNNEEFDNNLFYDAGMYEVYIKFNRWKDIFDKIYNNEELRKKYINAEDFLKKTMLSYLTSPLEGMERLDVEKVRTLLQEGADPNLADPSPLQNAIIRKDIELIKLLISYGANVNGVNYGRTPLYTAARFNNVDIMKILIDAGADVNLLSDRIPLLIGAVYGKAYDAMKMLLHLGVDPNFTDMHGKTGLDFARQFKDQRAIDILTGKEKI